MTLANLAKAIERGSEILGIRGQVFPATAVDVEQPEPCSQAIDAALHANLVVLGPGSLHTSLIPVLLIEELADAVRRSGARVVLVMNLTTEPGETDGYTAVDHLLAIRRHASAVPIHDVLLNATPVPDELMQPYSTSQAALVPPDTELLRALGHRPVMRELLGPGPKIRHDPHQLAGALLGLVPRVQAITEARSATMSPHRFSTP